MLNQTGRWREVKTKIKNLHEVGRDTTDVGWTNTKTNRKLHRERVRCRRTIEPPMGLFSLHAGATLASERVNRVR